jgi:hypothetical protein
LRALAPQLCAALLAAGCAGAGGVRPEVDALRLELRELRSQNAALSELARREKALQQELARARALAGGTGAA